MRNLDPSVVAALARACSGPSGWKRLLDLNRVYLFATAARQLEEDGVPGAVAELGVYEGRTATVLRALLPRRTLYLFDTFRGFPEQDVAEEPAAARDSRAVLAGLFRRTDLDVVKARVGGNGDTRYIVGRFPDSLQDCDLPDEYCLVHLDCDLRGPTLAALGYFYPRLAPGGFLVIHDYANPHWKGVRAAVDSFLMGRPERPVIGLDSGGSAYLRAPALPSNLREDIP